MTVTCPLVLGRLRAIQFHASSRLCFEGVGGHDIIDPVLRDPVLEELFPIFILAKFFHGQVYCLSLHLLVLDYTVFLVLFGGGLPISLWRVAFIFILALSAIYLFRRW